MANAGARDGAENSIDGCQMSSDELFVNGFGMTLLAWCRRWHGALRKGT